MDLLFTYAGNQFIIVLRLNEDCNSKPATVNRDIEN